MNITEKLFALRDTGYAAFQAKLVPTVEPERIIGVRTPALRQLAKEICQTEEGDAFLRGLPHYYYDENMLHAALLGRVKPYERCLSAVEEFLPYIDNWAVCDTLKPAVFQKHKKELLESVRRWAGSERPFVCRFGIKTLMDHFLDGDFRADLFDIPCGVKSDNHYVKTAVAWFFATALAKQWDDAISIVREARLPAETQNLAIRKATESYRISGERKDYLKSLKRDV